MPVDGFSRRNFSTSRLMSLVIFGLFFSQWTLAVEKKDGSSHKKMISAVGGVRDARVAKSISAQSARRDPMYLKLKATKFRDRFRGKIPWAKKFKKADAHNLAVAKRTPFNQKTWQKLSNQQKKKYLQTLLEIQTQMAANLRDAGLKVGQNFTPANSSGESFFQSLRWLFPAAFAEDLTAAPATGTEGAASSTPAAEGVPSELASLNCAKETPETPVCIFALRRKKAIHRPGRDTLVCPRDSTDACTLEGHAGEVRCAKYGAELCVPNDLDNLSKNCSKALIEKLQTAQPEDLTRFFSNAEVTCQLYNDDEFLVQHCLGSNGSIALQNAAAKEDPNQCRAITLRKMKVTEQDKLEEQGKAPEKDNPDRERKAQDQFKREDFEMFLKRRQYEACVAFREVRAVYVKMYKPLPGVPSAEMVTTEDVCASAPAAGSKDPQAREGGGEASTDELPDLECTFPPSIPFRTEASADAKITPGRTALTASSGKLSEMLNTALTNGAKVKTPQELFTLTIPALADEEARRFYAVDTDKGIVWCVEGQKTEGAFGQGPVQCQVSDSNPGLNLSKTTKDKMTYEMVSYVVNAPGLVTKDGVNIDIQQILGIVSSAAPEGSDFAKGKKTLLSVSPFKKGEELFFQIRSQRFTEKDENEPSSNSPPPMLVGLGCSPPGPGESSGSGGGIGKQDGGK